MTSRLLIIGLIVLLTALAGCSTSQSTLTLGDVGIQGIASAHNARPSSPPPAAQEVQPCSRIASL